MADDLANLQLFFVVWTLIYHDLRHHMIKMFAPRESATNVSVYIKIGRRVLYSGAEEKG